MASIFGNVTLAPHTHTLTSNTTSNALLGGGNNWGSIAIDDPQLEWEMSRRAQIEREIMWAQTTQQTNNVATTKEPKAKHVRKGITYEPKAEVLKTYDRAAFDEYIQVASEIGMAVPGLVVEEFKSFLVDNNFTVYSLSTVIEFMDKKAADDDAKGGWHWCALRAKDVMQRTWGRRAVAHGFDHVTPASDHNSGQVYSKPVPLHALKKVAAIEKGFKHKVAFYVTDYAPAPEYKPDPFLMAVVWDATDLSANAGTRFIIDVWDEPGFGIEQMLKSDLVK